MPGKRARACVREVNFPVLDITQALVCGACYISLDEQEVFVLYWVSFDTVIGLF